MDMIMRKAAVEDNKLPHLQKALDPQAMAPAFEEFFRAEYPNRELKVDELQIGRVYYKPDKNCGIIYRLSYRDQENRPLELMFYGKMPANGKANAKPEREQPTQWPGCGFWKPVSFWPEMDMVLHTFPYDPELPYLGQLLEIDFVKQQVEENLDGFGLPSGWKCLEITPFLGKYRPNKRCILRYQLVMADAAGNRRQFVFYSKTYDSPQSRYVYGIVRKLYASPACASGQLNIPRPLAHLDSANTLWLLAWEGRNFNATMQQQGWEHLPQSGFMPKIAGMLAALHQIDMTELQLVPGPSPASVLENMRGDIDDIARFLPEQRPVLDELIRILEDAAGGLEADAPQATIHGTFKVAQILCRDDPDGRSQLALVDFDSVACGDPLYDVAEFIASLLYLRMTDRIPAASIMESVEIFLTSYQKQVPWVCDRRRLAWYVIAFLLGKMHSSLKRLEVTAGENLDEAFALVHEWLDIVKRNA
jgi:hypothetical protein